jgi:hypothetical protein
MPRTTIDPEDPNTETIYLDGIIPSRTLVIYWSRDRRPHPPLDAFIQATQTVCATIDDEDATTACVQYAT